MAGDNLVDAPTVRAGLLQAMYLGEPPNEADKPYFVVPGVGSTTYMRHGFPVLASQINLDAQGEPLDPSVKVSRPPPTHVQIPIAVEFTQADAAEMPVGAFRPTKVTITILDYDTDGTPLWAQVQDATDIVLGGDTYALLYRLPPVGLGTITVYQLVGFARQES